MNINITKKSILDTFLLFLVSPIIPVVYVLLMNSEDLKIVMLSLGVLLFFLTSVTYNTPVRRLYDKIFEYAWVVLLVIVLLLSGFVIGWLIK